MLSNRAGFPLVPRLYSPQLTTLGRSQSKEKRPRGPGFVRTQSVGCEKQRRRAVKPATALYQELYGVSGCVPQSPLNSLMSGVCVTWKRPLPSCGCRELRSALPELDPGPARIPRAPRESVLSAPTVLVFRARARIPDRFELGKVDGLAPRRVSVGFEERPATQRFCTRAASRRAGRDGGGDRAAATQHVAPAH